MRKRRGRPFDRNRIAADRRRLSAARDGERLAIDPCFEQTIHGVEKIVAVELRMEAQDTAAEQALQQLVPPRADRERLGIRPWNVPERDDRRLWQPLADHLRHEREMVVLHEHDRIRSLRLGGHRLGEARVHLAVVIPVAAPKRRPHVRDVAKRP